MKLLITATTYPRYKGDTIPGFVHDFAKKMAKEPEVSEVHVLVPHAEGVATHEVMDGVYIHRYRYWFTARGESITYGGAVKKTSRSPLYILKLASLLLCQLSATIRLTLTYRIDSINAHWLIPMGTIGVMTKLLTGVKVVVTIHGGDVFSLKNGIVSKVKAWTLKHADAVVVNSSATQMEAVKLYPKRTYPIIPMGVDVENLQPRTKKRRRKNDPLRLLFAGRIVEEKGVDYLVEAVAKLAQEKCVVHLTIAGTGTYEATLKDKVKKLGIREYVTFKGWVEHDRYPELFAEADIFVGPSIVANNGWQEAFGLVFAESLALNTPVIGTTTGGIVDIVTNEQNGLLVPQRDTQALAAAIKQFIAKPQLVEDFAQGARDDIISRFSWQTSSKKYLNIFRKLLN